ncbi:MAG: sigma-70 family RNA polymerase sigma factor [Gemmatimonadaceae bacterium]|nr:sigma-70 family RNA polymerase sigma factor [Gemmatimonadaceae bacterium]
MDADRLFREYHGTLVRYLTRRLGDRDWAEEVAQETFVRALRQDAIASERSWLFAVASNLVRDEARRVARRRQHLQLLAAEEREASAPDDAGGMTPERARDAACARRALDSLGERDRKALLLKAEGLDYGEIATVLEIEKASVGTTLSRARRRLAETYDALRSPAQPGSEGHAAS